MSIAHGNIAKFILFSVLAGTSAQLLAGDGTIRFSGSIAEPVCSVQGTAGMAAKSARLQSPSGNIQLAVRCNTVQSVQISFEEPRQVIEELASSGDKMAEMVLSSADRTIRSGDSMHYTFAAREDIAIPLTASMRQAGGANSGQMRKNIMVSFDYQ